MISVIMRVVVETCSNGKFLLYEIDGDELAKVY